MNAGQSPGATGQMNAPGVNTGQGFQQGGNFSQNENTRFQGKGPNGMTAGKYTKSSRSDIDRGRRYGRDFDQGRRYGRDFDHDRRYGYLERRHDRDIDRRVVASGQYREGTGGYGWNGGYSGWNGGWGGWGWGGPSFDVSVGYGGWGGPGYGYGYGYPGLYSYAPGYAGVAYGGGGCTCGGGGPGWQW